MNRPSIEQYRESLFKFPRYLENSWKTLDPDREYFGDGSSGEDGIRPMGNVIFVLGVLVRELTATENGSTWEQRSMLRRKHRCSLRYLTDGHVTGRFSCANGQQWGGAWQSSWWASRMALGARLIWDELSAAEKESVKRVVLFEADKHLSRTAPSGIFEDTKAEENAWDLEILAVACGLFPGEINSIAWKAKLREFAFNTFSVSSDLTNESIVDGARVSESVYTVNLHSDFTLENHGSYHFCYVASPLHSLTWASYALELCGETVPAALSHHVKDVWSRAKSTFLKNHFAYVGGQDWARYTYGQYFILPVSVYLQGLLQDAASGYIEGKRFACLVEEQAESDDGSFFGRRFTSSNYSGQNAKYETDCYANMALALCLRKELKTELRGLSDDEFSKEVSCTHVSPECGIAFTRTSNFFCSFSWRTLTSPHPTATFIPLKDDSLMEFQPSNLLGRIVTKDKVASGLWIRSMRKTQSGFEVKGKVIFLSEGGRFLYRQEITFSLDAQRERASVKSEFYAESVLDLRRTEGLTYHFGNDRFNSFGRDIYSSSGLRRLAFDPLKKNRLLVGPVLIKKVIRRVSRATRFSCRKIGISGSWINIDNRIGIISSNANTRFSIESSFERQSTWNSLHFELIRSSYLVKRRIVDRGDLIFSNEHIIFLADAIKTKELAAE